MAGGRPPKYSEKTLKAARDYLAECVDEREVMYTTCGRKRRASAEQADRLVNLGLSGD